MANKADKDRVRGDIAGPDYAGAIAIIRDQIAGKKNRLSTINGEISGLWDTVEKKGVNTQGAKIFLRLDGMDEADRNDVLRTVQAMADEAGWNKQGDMIDQAGGNVIEMPRPAAKQPAAEKPPKGAAKAAAAAAAAAEKAPAPAGDADLNPTDVLDRADYIQVMADQIAANSVLNPDEAHKAAVEIWTDLPNRDRDAPRTRENALANADKEMESWPEDDGQGGGEPAA